MASKAAALLPFLLVFISQQCDAFFTMPGASQASSKNAALISKAETFMNTATGFYSPPDPDQLSDDLVFAGGIVGPLNKNDYVQTMTRLGVYKAWDMQHNAFGFCVDPDDPSTVRFFVRYSGQQTSDWIIEGVPMKYGMVGTRAQGITEAVALKFDEEGKVKFFTIGNIVSKGNPEGSTTNKKGAVFGLFETVGAGYQLGAAFNKDFRNLLSWVVDNNLAPLPTFISANVPAWYKGD